MAKVTDRVVRDAIGIGHPGPAPVQLNVGLREPLVPDPGVDQIPIDSAETSGAASAGRAARTDQLAVGDLGLAEVPARGVVLVGDVPNPQIAQQAMELADACGWPVISEPSGNALAGATGIPAASVPVADEEFRTSHAPDFLLTIGRFGISRPIMRLVASADHHLAVAVGGRIDRIRCGLPQRSCRASRGHPMVIQ